MPAVMGNKEIHKLFDRSTPAGAAMYALYNASENESRTAGNAYSKRNAVRIAAQGRRAMLKAAMEPEPEAQIQSRPKGPAMAGEVWVPKVGRRKGRVRQNNNSAPPRPGRRPMAASVGVLIETEREIISQQQFDAARTKTRTVDRGAMIAQLQRSHTYAGTDAAQLEQQARQAQLRIAQPVRAEDEFESVMAEIEERNEFLTQMRQLGKEGSYEATIKREIAERVQRLKEIDRMRLMKAH